MTFDGVRVLSDVDLSIAAGEIHGLVGENGSGKSTLVKILGGVYDPDRGSEVGLHGEAISLPVRDTRQHGLAIVHQDLALVETMSVADNTGISTSYERRRSHRLVRDVRLESCATWPNSLASPWTQKQWSARFPRRSGR